MWYTGYYMVCASNYLYLRFLSSVSYNFPSEGLLHPWSDLFPGILIFFVAILNGIVFLIYISVNSLLAYKNATISRYFTSLIPHSTGSPSHNYQKRRRNKRHLKWKGRSKTIIICRWHVFVLREPKDSTRKLLELISEFSKVAGYKINI